MISYIPSKKWQFKHWVYHGYLLFGSAPPSHKVVLVLLTLLVIPVICPLYLIQYFFSKNCWWEKKVYQVFFGRMLGTLSHRILAVAECGPPVCIVMNGSFTRAIPEVYALDWDFEKELGERLVIYSDEKDGNEKADKKGVAILNALAEDLATWLTQQGGTVSCSPESPIKCLYAQSGNVYAELNWAKSKKDREELPAWVCEWM